jgi:hypothetical protein
MEEKESEYAGLAQQNGSRPAFLSSLPENTLGESHEGMPKTDPFDLGPQNRLTISPKNLMM